MILYITYISTNIPIFVPLHHIDMKIILFKVDQEVIFAYVEGVCFRFGGQWMEIGRTYCLHILICASHMS